MAQTLDILLCGLGAAGLEALACLSEKAPKALRIAAIEAGEAPEVRGHHVYWKSQAKSADLDGLESVRMPEFTVRTASGFHAEFPAETRLLNNAAFMESRSRRISDRIPVFTNCWVLRSYQQPGHAVVHTSLGTIRARIVIDTSGQDSVLATEAGIGSEDDPRRSWLARTIDDAEVFGENQLFMDLFDWGLEEGVGYVRAFPAGEGTRYEVNVWSRQNVSEKKLRGMMDRYLIRRAILGQQILEETGIRKTGGLRQLRRGRFLFAGTSGGLGLPWTGDHLEASILSARAAAHAALLAIQAGDSLIGLKKALAGYAKMVHQGNRGLGFRWQDVGKGVILRMHPERSAEFYEEFFSLPPELVTGFLSCNLPLRDLMQIIRLFWEKNRFEELPWAEALNGGLQALARYAHRK